jgi:branched-chain amino acid transport system substrate-binding protein
MHLNHLKHAAVQMKFAAVVAASVLTLGIAACGDDDDDTDSTSTGASADTVRIGLEAPLSGDLETLGQGMLNGAELAADQLNEDGGLLGKDIEIVPIDDGGDAAVGVPAVNDAIAAGLDGVVGPYNSGVGVETLPLYEKAGLVPIRLTSDTDTEGFGFTLQPMGSQIAPVTGQAIQDYIGAKKVAIAYDETEEYNVGISEEVRAELQKRGVQVTAYEPLKPGQADYSALVNKLSAGKPDAIYAAVYSPEGATIAKAITPGSSPTCLLDFGAFDTGYLDEAGDAASNCEVFGVPAPDDFSGSETYVSDYEDEFDEFPGGYSPYTYDSVNLLAQAVEQTGGFEPKALTAALDTVKGFKGWTGTASLVPGSGNREPNPTVLDIVEDGAFTVDPEWAKAVGAPFAN